MASWFDRILGRVPPSGPPLLAASNGVEIVSGPQGGSVSRRTSETTRSRWWGSSSYDLQRDEALDATPLSVKQIFDEAATGRTRRMIDLYKSVRRYDSRLDAVAATRVLAISSRSYVLRTPPGMESDSRALGIARACGSCLNEVKGLSTLIGHLGHGVLEHAALLEHNWRRSPRLQMWNTHPRWVHPNRVGWRLPDVLPAWSETETNTWEGKPIAGRLLEDWPDRFVFFAPVAGRSDYPWHRGALRARVGPSTVKRLTARFWVKLLERFGQPQVVAYRDGTATGGASASDNEDDEVLAMLRAMGSDWRGVLPPGWKVESINVQVAENLHRLFIEHHDREDAIALLGQNLSTDIPKGGSFAAAKAHQLVRLDVLASDLAELAECITDQWIEPLVRYNFGADAPVPYFDFVLGARSEITVQAYQAGLFSADEVRASMGYDPEVNDTGKRYFVGVMPSTKVVSGKRVGAPDDEDVIDVEIEEPSEAQPIEDDVAKAAASEGAAVADLAFNGAQVQALQGLVTTAGVDVAPRAAELVITSAFPSIDERKASEMIEQQRAFVETKRAAEAEQAAVAAATSETDTSSEDA